ncbi:MAG TPA: two-component regulator propeller domain-containing protein, partial [Myxococcota bacterium]|nr:two-component regulator propeller domain-containing protein [Myxococcota bacterium]
DDIRDVLFVGGALYVATDSGVCVLNDPAAAAAVIATTLCDDVIAVNDARSLSHRNGVLWIGTDNGLVRRDLSSGGAVTFDRDAGLPSDNINDVVVAPDGIVWVATDSGVGRLDPETGHVVTLSPPDWNGSAQVNSILIAPDGSKWFGTDEGVVHYVGA